VALDPGGTMIDRTPALEVGTIPFSGDRTGGDHSRKFW